MAKILERIRAWRLRRTAPRIDPDTSKDWKTVGKTFRATDAVFDKMPRYAQIPGDLEESRIRRQDFSPLEQSWRTTAAARFSSSVSSTSGSRRRAAAA
jgi:hypothetical protein